jgi:L-lactate dehydrogenase complex protein LldE
MMRVGLFVTCLVDLMRPRIGFAALKLLKAAGCEVVVPASQTCCGQPGYNSGDRASAKALALKFMREFTGCDYVVAPSGSCAGMVRVHYRDLFEGEPELLRQTQELADRTYELTDFLVNVARLEKAPGVFGGRITYHDSCSGLRELGVKQQPRVLLSGMRGIKLQELQNCETCCGFGGTFAVKFGEISTRLADDKCRAIETSGADAVVLGDLGCILNIEGRLSRRGNRKTQVLHVAEVLAGEG